MVFKNFPANAIVNSENAYAINATALFKKYWLEAYISMSSGPTQVNLKKKLRQEADTYVTNLEQEGADDQDKEAPYDSDEEHEKPKQKRELHKTLDLDEDEDLDYEDMEVGPSPKNKNKNKNKNKKSGKKEKKQKRREDQGESNAQKILEDHPEVREEIEKEISQGNIDINVVTEDPKVQKSSEEGEYEPDELMRRIDRHESLGRSKNANEVSELELQKRLESDTLEKTSIELEVLERERDEKEKVLKDNRKKMKKLKRDKEKKEKEIEFDEMVSSVLKKGKKEKKGKKGKKDKDKEKTDERSNKEKKDKLKKKILREERKRQKERDRERKEDEERLEQFRNMLMRKEKEVRDLKKEISETRNKSKEESEQTKRLYEIKLRELEEERKRVEKEKKEDQREIQMIEEKDEELDPDLENLELKRLRERLDKEAMRYNNIYENIDYLEEKILNGDDPKTIKKYEKKRIQLRKELKDSKAKQGILLGVILVLEEIEKKKSSVTKKRKTEREKDPEEDEENTPLSSSSPTIQPDKSPDQIEKEEKISKIEEMMKELAKQNSSLQKQIEEMNQKIITDKEVISHTNNVLDSIENERQSIIIDLVKEEIEEEEVEESPQVQNQEPVTNPEPMPELVSIPPDVQPQIQPELQPEEEPSSDPSPQPAPLPEPASKKRIIKRNKVESPSFFSFNKYSDTILETYQTDIMLVLMSLYSELRNKYSDKKIPINKGTVEISKIANIPDLEGVYNYLSNGVSYVKNESENSIKISPNPSGIDTKIQELKKEISKIKEEVSINKKELDVLEKKKYTIVYFEEKRKHDKELEEYSRYSPFKPSVPKHTLDLKYFNQMISGGREKDLERDIYSIDGEPVVSALIEIRKDIEALARVSSFQKPDLKGPEKSLRNIEKFKRKIDALNIPSNINPFSPNVGIGFSEVYKVFFYNKNSIQVDKTIFRLPTYILSSQFPSQNLRDVYPQLETLVGKRTSFTYLDLGFNIKKAFPYDKSPEDRLTNLFMLIDFPEVTGFPNTDERSTKVNFLESLIVLQYQLFSSLFLPFSRTSEGILDKALSLIISFTVSSASNISSDYLQVEKVEGMLNKSYGFLPNYEINTEILMAMYFDEIKKVLTENEIKEVLYIYRSNIYALSEISSYVSLQLRFLKKNLPKFVTQYQVYSDNDKQRVSELIEIMIGYGKDTKEKVDYMGKTNYHIYNLLLRLQLFDISTKVTNVESYFDKVYGYKYVDVLVDFLAFSNLSPFRDIPIANSILCTKLKREQIRDEIYKKMNEVMKDSNLVLNFD